ncbi:hypothetical protein ISCGN_006509, partial [Ixodes scapularis]
MRDSPASRGTGGHPSRSTPSCALASKSDQPSVDNSAIGDTDRNSRSWIKIFGGPHGGEDN